MQSFLTLLLYRLSTIYVFEHVSQVADLAFRGLRQSNIASERYLNSSSCQSYRKQFGRYTYHSRFIPEGVAEESQIFLQDAHVLPKLLIYEEYCRRDRW
jgi:hypothetical protein